LAFLEIKSDRLALMGTRRRISVKQQQRWAIAFWVTFILANLQLVFMIWLLTDKRASFIREPNPATSQLDRLAWFWIVPGTAVDLGASAALAIVGLVGLARARQGYSPWSVWIAIWILGHAALVALSVWALRHLGNVPGEWTLGVCVFRIGLANVPMLFWLNGLVGWWLSGKQIVPASDGGH
jgi:hypothetical protein